MTKGNPVKNYPRSVFSTANQYQDKIILLTFFPSTLIFLSFICLVFIGNPIFSKVVLHASFPAMEKLMNQFSGWIVFLMCSIFFFSLMIAFVISHHMVGAFGRINRELDDIIAGRSQKAITCRPNDDLTKDLLKRVNVLVKYYAEHKYGNKNP